MVTSGLVLTLPADEPTCEQILEALRRVGVFTIGERYDRHQAVALEAPDEAASENWHRWLSRLPGVDHVDVTFLYFGSDFDETSMEAAHVAR